MKVKSRRSEFRKATNNMSKFNMKVLIKVKIWQIQTKWSSHRPPASMGYELKEINNNF